MDEAVGVGCWEGERREEGEGGAAELSGLIVPDEERVWGEGLDAARADWRIDAVEAARCGFDFIEGIKSSAVVVEIVGCADETARGFGARDELDGPIQLDRLERIDAVSDTTVGGRRRARFTDAAGSRASVSFPFPFPLTSSLSSVPIRTSPSSSILSDRGPLIVRTELALLPALLLPLAVPSPLPPPPLPRNLETALLPLLMLIRSSSS